MSNETLYNTSYIIERICAITEKNPCKKELQKIAFLIEASGLDLGYSHGLHFYGPYSSILDSCTMTLYAEGVVKIHYSGYSHLLSVDNEKFLENNNMTEEHRTQIDEIIDRFKDYSPSDLELLTTAIYAYDHLENKSMESVIAGVKKIKGAKYSDSKIRGELENLRYFEKEFA